MSFGYQVLGFGAFPNRTPPAARNVGFSAMFESNNDEFLNATPGAGDQQKWTISFWTKFCEFTARQVLIGQGDAYISYNEDSGTTIGADYDATSLALDGKIYLYIAGSSPVWNWQTSINGLCRDPNAWYHLTVSHDSTNGTADHRLRLYINGVEFTDFTKSSTGNQNAEQDFGGSDAIKIGQHPANSNNDFKGYMAEFVYIDGAQHSPTSFGSFADNGAWIPIDVAGLTFGTKGFYLPFSATGGDLGDDASGNGFDFTNNNTVTRVLDSPTVNAATLQRQWSVATLDEGNLKASNDAAAYDWAMSTIALPPKGKWAFEAQSSNVNGTNKWALVGICQVGNHVVRAGLSYVYAFNIGNGEIVKDGGAVAGPGAAGTSLIRVEYNADDDQITFFDDNTQIHQATTNLSGHDSLHFFVAPLATSGTTDITATFVGLNDTPTSGFLELTAENIFNNAYAISDSSTFFDTVLYEGTGAELEIDSLAFQPDFVWIKNRDATDAHMLFQVLSGATIHNSTNLRTGLVTTAETLKSFDSTGFTLGTDVKVNTDGENYVAWCWKAGGSASTNDNGSIDSSVSANTTAGFSIGTYTGTGSGGATIGHGLGKAPDFLVVKESEAANDGHWKVQHKGNLPAPEDHYLLFNTTTAREDNATIWNDTAMGTDVFTVGSDTSTNRSGGVHLFLAWTSIEGFSKFGLYEGNNGGATGHTNPVVYTGFTPELVIIKNIDAAHDYMMTDATRSPRNQADKQLRVNTNAVENTASDYRIDLYSNGFMARNNNPQIGASNSYIYMAWAKNPFGAEDAIATAQ